MWLVNILSKCLIPVPVKCIMVAHLAGQSKSSILTLGSHSALRDGPFGGV